MKQLTFLLLVLLLTSSLFADPLNKLQGTWKLDRAGTSEMYRNSPDWTEKKERYLGDIIDYIGRYTFIIENNKLERRFYRERLSWNLNNLEQDSSVLTFASKDKEGKDLEVQITQMGQELIHIRIGLDDNYRLCAWRKQAPQKPKKEMKLPTLEEMLEKMMEQEGRATQEI